MNRVVLKTAILALILAIGVLFFVLSNRGPIEDAALEGAIDEELGQGVQTVELAFADRAATGLLVERRRIEVPEDRTGRARALLQALAEGPEESGSVATLPQGTRVLSVFFDGTGEVFVDFSGELVSNHPGGSTGELMTIRSVVRTLALNFDDVTSVRFLVEGKEVETIAGHLDASESFSVEQYR